jgi:hypothetical protein
MIHSYNGGSINSSHGLHVVGRLRLSSGRMQIVAVDVAVDADNPKSPKAIHNPGSCRV